MKSSFTLKEAIQGFVFSLGAEGKSKRTSDYYSKLLLYLVQYADEADWPGSIELITTQHIRQFLAWTGSRRIEYVTGHGCRRSHLATSNMAWPYFKAVRRFFNWLQEEGLLQDSPVRGLSYKPPASAPVQPYSVEELRKLLEVCDYDIRSGARFIGLRNKALLLLFVDSALRLSEMTGIRMSDINMEQRLIRIVGKGNKPAHCPFSDATAKVLYFYMTLRDSRAKCDALWITEEGTRFSKDGLGAWFTRLKKRAGINGSGGVHRLRHTAAIQFLRVAKDSFLLQLYLRHEDLAMSRRYTRALQLEEAVLVHRNGASPVESMGLR